MKNMIESILMDADLGFESSLSLVIIPVSRVQTRLKIDNALPSNKVSLFGGLIEPSREVLRA
jgi:hypothetical protein